MLERGQTLECTTPLSRTHDLEGRSQKLPVRPQLWAAPEFSSATRSRTHCALQAARPRLQVA
eukprot:545477-Alexandrium_andersonii.AAC.1